MVRAKWLVLLITLIAVGCAASWGLVTAKYKSQGFFQFSGAIPIPAKDKDKYKDKYKNREKYKDNDKDKDKTEPDPDPGIALSDFKRFAASYSTSERLNEYLTEKKLLETQWVAQLRKKVTRDGLAQVIEPIYPFTKLDAKLLMEQPKGSSNNVIGLRIEYEDNSPETAQQIVGLLGRYVNDSIVYLLYSDVLRFKSEEIRTKLTEIENKIIRNKMQLDEYRRRGVELQKIIARNPTAANQGSRQVVTIDDETSHYLPPATLLTTAEVQAVEMNEVILRAQRDQLQNKLLLEYYGRAKSILDSTKSGETLLRSLEPIKESVFKNKDLHDEAVKEVFNTLTIENQSAINLYLNKNRFIAGPTLPEYSTYRWWMIIAAGLLLGLMASALLVFGRIWWAKQSAQLQAD
jgi:hypothetical protein